MEPIRNLTDLFVVYDIHPRDPKREDKLRERIFNRSVTGVTIIPDNVGVRVVGWAGEQDTAGETVSYHRALAYPFLRLDLSEAIDAMEELICATGFSL
jgi:hypothetical protein